MNLYNSSVVYSVTKSCPTLCDSMNCNKPGFPGLYYLLEFAQTHVHWVMPSNHFILCHPLLLLPSVFPSIRVFSNGWSFSPSQSCFAHRASSLASSQAPLAIAVEMSFSVCAATAYLRGDRRETTTFRFQGGMSTDVQNLTSPHPTQHIQICFWKHKGYVLSQDSFDYYSTNSLEVFIQASQPERWRHTTLPSHHMSHYMMQHWPALPPWPLVPTHSVIHSTIWEQLWQHVTNLRIIRKCRFGHLLTKSEMARGILPKLRELFGIFKNNFRDSIWEMAMLKCSELM